MMAVNLGGNAGSTPAAARTASGNLAGWAVARVTMGVSAADRRLAAANPQGILFAEGVLFSEGILFAEIDPFSTGVTIGDPFTLSQGVLFGEGVLYAESALQSLFSRSCNVLVAGESFTYE